MTWGPYAVRYGHRPILTLALGSAWLVATLLLIPDAIALLPVVPNQAVWLLRLAGQWLSAAFLWAIGLISLLYLLRAVSGPVVINDRGIKLWRFGGLLPWNAIAALSVDRQPFFEKLLLLKAPVCRLAMYEKRGQRLVPRYLPSFLFDGDRFRSLVACVAQRAHGFIPDGLLVVVFRPEEGMRLSRLYARAGKLRVALAVIIAVGLFVFLNRKATVNYQFNKGTVAFRQGDYQAATRFYRLSLACDPHFAVAWDQLARSEFRLGRQQEAKRCWIAALKAKPDLVRSKIGLSSIYMQEGDHDRARQLLWRSIRLEPEETAAYLNLVVLELKAGHPGEAERIARRLVETGRETARSRCLLARALVALNRPGEAHAVLSGIDRSLLSVDERQLYDLAAAEVARARIGSAEIQTNGPVVPGLAPATAEGERQ